jgi:hypothetical protein
MARFVQDKYIIVADTKGNGAAYLIDLDMFDLGWSVGEDVNNALSWKTLTEANDFFSSLTKDVIGRFHNAEHFGVDVSTMRVAKLTLLISEL